MTTKQYLNQISRIDCEIQNTKWEIEHIRDIATCITANTDREAVQTSGTSDKVGNAIVKISEKEEELLKLVIDRNEKRDEIVSQLQQIDNNDYYRILFDRYVKQMTFERIAVDMNMSWRHVVRLHGRALDAFSCKFSEIYANVS